MTPVAPDRAAPAADRGAGRAAPEPPVVEALHGLTDPWPAFRRLAAWPGVVFLDSALRHPELGRYSYLAADPALMLRWREGVWRADGRFAAAVSLPAGGDVLSPLRSLLAAHPLRPVAGLPPFQGGIAGLFGYGLGRQFERLPPFRHDEFRTPDLAAGVYDWVLAFDHVRQETWLISTGWPEPPGPGRRRRARERAAAVKRLLDGPVPRTADRPPSRPIAAADLFPGHPLPGSPGVTSSFRRADYLAAVRRAVEYVHAGDCFQINIAQRLLAPQPPDAVELYARLRSRNPATFAGYFDLGDLVVASSSPERFLRVDERGHVETRPIKGTRPRGATAAEDADRVRELQGSPKDRAENIMIVDLLRNDLGRVCEYGSVRVAELCRVESYQTVHHLVSVVEGRLRAGLGPLDLFPAAFPGGSVTGAPKVRAMEIIAELEPTSRGPYCGSLGYIGFSGAADTSILIRTMTLGRGWAQFPVGGGIVADSVPELEYEETLHKAAGLLRALGEDGP
jgi:para-aminobenzoate synthetase component 1